MREADIECNAVNSLFYSGRAKMAAEAIPFQSEASEPK